MASTDVVTGANSARGLENLSPFELKDKLIEYAKDSTQEKSATHKFLNAGRGNPNWVATTPREAFFLARAVRARGVEARVGRARPRRACRTPTACAGRLAHVPRMRVAERRSRSCCARASTTASTKLGFDADAFVHELVDSIVGDNYPVPDRMLVHAERVVQRVPRRRRCAASARRRARSICSPSRAAPRPCVTCSSSLRREPHPASGRHHRARHADLHAVPRDAAARRLRLQDRRHRARRDGATGCHTWQYPDAEIAKLEDPKVKAFFIVNPSNPASFAMAPRRTTRIVELVRDEAPGSASSSPTTSTARSSPGFRSLAADLPHNTILVYSYSKHFGCTGWRLGVVALHEDNMLDDMIAQLPDGRRRGAAPSATVAHARRPRR